MESPDCPDQRSEGGDLLKNESAAGRGDHEPEPSCNGFGEEEDSRKIHVKRKMSSPEVDEGGGGGGGGGGRKAYGKAEDHGRGSEVPAHHARRPPNGFLLFCKRHRDIVSAKNPNLENRGVTKLLGNWWRTLEDDDREKYKDLARQNKEIFIANNPQFTWYKLPAPPLRTLVTRPSNRRPPKLEPSVISSAGPITPGKLADESQLGGLTSLLSSSVSPPTTPLNVSPPSPTGGTVAAPPPKKRFLLQTRATKQSGEEGQSLSESDETSEGNARKRRARTTKKKYKKKKGWNSLKYKKNLKAKWTESLSGRHRPGDEGEDGWKSENGCTHQDLIEKIVDSSFEGQKQDLEVRRTLDYINTEHTYQKNPGRYWQQQQGKPNQKSNKKEECGGEGENEGSVITPNVNNNTIVLGDGRPEVRKNGLSYSFNDNNNLIIDYFDPNQRKLDQSSIQTNHDRIRTNTVKDGYIPGGKRRCADDEREDCDNKRLEDQNKPFKIAQDENEEREEDEEEEEEEEDDEDDEEEEDDGEDEEDEEEEVEKRNCDKDNADFQSILGKVSREIVSMIKERGPEDAEDMAVARFNVARSRSETDSDGSWYDKSDGSPPESPEGRRSKRSCKGQRYEQFIKDSVSKKRGKASEWVGDAGHKGKRRKVETESLESSGNRRGSSPSARESKNEPESNSQSSEDLTLKHGTKASDVIQLKLDLESRLGSGGRRQKETKATTKKKPVSKVQMIKEKREIHVGEFNLNEKIEELPLLSFESFLQKKRQRKKRLLGLKKEGMKNKIMKGKLERVRGRSPNGAESASVPVVPNRQTHNSLNKPDFADLTTLAETALTLLSLREPR